MAVDMFLKLDGVPGEARDSAHAKEIDIHSYNWSVEQLGDFSHGFGGGVGRVNINKLACYKSVDASSAMLTKCCVNGRHIPTCTLTVRKAGGEKQVEYVIYEFEKIIVTSVEVNVDQESEGIDEVVHLSFQKVTFKYQEQGDDGAKLGGEKEFSYDVATNLVA